MLTTFFLRKKKLCIQKRTKDVVSPKKQNIVSKKTTFFLLKKKKSCIQTLKFNRILVHSRTAVLDERKLMPHIPKMMSIGRKGSGWLLFFFAVFLLMMGVILMYEIIQEKQSASGKIGGVQIEVSNLFLESENERFEKQLILRGVLNEALIEIADNGGFSKDNSCGRYGSYVVWDYNNCWPDVEKNFQLLVERKLKERKIDYKGASLLDGDISVDFGEKKFNKTLGKAVIGYQREIIVREPVNIDFDAIAAIKRKILDGRNKGDYSGLGKVENGYIALSIENNKRAFIIDKEKGIVTRKIEFKFALSVP